MFSKECALTLTLRLADKYAQKHVFLEQLKILRRLCTSGGKFGILVEIGVFGSIFMGSQILMVTFDGLEIVQNDTKTEKILTVPELTHSNWGHTKTGNM